MLPSSIDVVVVGAGNAALCAALAAAEQGVSVLILERAPENEAGGNSRFTAGAFPLRLQWCRRFACADA
jgi:tricarballylate dehydrogenase